jgi:hypothetical protein
MLLVKRLSVPEAFKRARPRITRLLSQVVGVVSPDQHQQEQIQQEVSASQQASSLHGSNGKSSSEAPAGQVEAAPQPATTRRGRYLLPRSAHKQEGYLQQQQQPIQLSQQEGDTTAGSSAVAGNSSNVPAETPTQAPARLLELPPPLRMGPPLIPAGEVDTLQTPSA